jgi:tagaturonate reductase
MTLNTSVQVKLPNLSIDVLPQIQNRKLEIPAASVLCAPEKILQLGWGKFMRGFVPDFVQLANADGHYDGRILTVQREADDRSATALRQDCLYTLILRGRQSNQPIEIKRVIGSVSRVLSAHQNWPDVQAAVRKRELRAIVSNATETGLKFDPEDRPEAGPPRSFPGKMVQLLFERWKALGATDSDVAVIPTELVLDNGTVVRNLLLQQTETWKLNKRFREWLQQSVHVASTLVDRIVVGTPRSELLAEECEAIGYRDELLTCCEPYYLFAIQADEFTRRHFPLHRTTPNVRFVEDLAPFRSRKLRLLNGPQMVLTTLGTLLDFRIVSESVRDSHVGPFTEETVWQEIIPAMGEEERKINSDYARECYQRIGNPTIEHRLDGIRVDLTTKNAIRLFPSIRDFMKLRGELPERLLLTVAATLAAALHVELQDVHADYIVQSWSDSQPVSRESAIIFTRKVLARLSESAHEDLDIENIAPRIADLFLQIREWGLRTVLTQRFSKAHS